MAYKHNVLMYFHVDWRVQGNAFRRQLVVPLARELQRCSGFLLVIDRFLNPTDVLRKPRKVREFLAHPGPQRVADNCYVVKPWVLLHDRMANRSRMLTTLNRRLLRAQLQRAIRRFGLDPHRLTAWIMSPNYHYCLDLVNERYVIADWFDRLSRNLDGTENEAWARFERRIFSRCDLAFVTVENLKAHVDRWTPNAHLVANGVDFEALHRARRPGPRPASLEGLPPPIIGHIGNLRAIVDFALVEHLLRENPDCTFVFLGAVEQGARPGVARWKKHPNCHVLGPVLHDELYRYLRHFDVGIIVYRLNEFSRYGDILKALQYLAAGKPVVASWLPCLEKYRGYIEVARSASEFSARLRGIVSNLEAHRSADQVERRTALARAHSWKDRARQMVDRIEEALG